MELTARVTADAQVSTLKDERTVVNFTVAHNEYYRAKGSTESKQVTEFIRCDYWLNKGIAQYLTKGTLVELSGRMGVNAYTNAEGKAIANLTCHVNTIKLHGGGKAKTETPKEVKATVSADDDLPF